MKKMTILSMLLLTGCATKYVLPPFPSDVEGQCGPLTVIEKNKDGTALLSDITDVVTENYAKYHKCSAKVEAFNEWYKQQSENAKVLKLEILK